jgi:hypothetical protein
MTTTHKSKTISALLGLTLGSIGAHRFYLYGKKDLYAWLHFSSLPFSFMLSKLYFNLNGLITYSPWLVSLMISLLVTMVLGLTADEKWDAKFNANSGKTSETNWPIAFIIIGAGFLGAMTLLFMIARAFDLYLTGGAYG